MVESSFGRSSITHGQPDVRCCPIFVYHWGKNGETHQFAKPCLSLLVNRPNPVIHSLLLFFQHLWVTLLETLEDLLRGVTARMRRGQLGGKLK